MPWDRARPGGGKTAAKYRDPAYIATGRRLRAELAAIGRGTCAEAVCLMPSRLLLPGMKLHVCHDRRTGAIRGLGHRRCNVSEAARYARSLQNATTLRL